jgi:hypothetical protein
VNAAFIGVDSHFSYTKSSRFLIDVLRGELGSLAVFTSEWRWIHLPRKKHWDLLVYFQHFPQRWEIDCLDVGNIVLVPMFDDCPKDAAFWSTYRDCRVLCFSSTLAELLRGFGMNVLSVQYFPPVPDAAVDWDAPGLSAFFWPRTHMLNWSHVRPLFEGAAWERIHIHRTDNLSKVAIDIGETEESRLPLKSSSWFDSPAQFRELLGKHKVFFAPRRAEGIGHSFLEAMSCGMAVISANGPTMSEYIRSGENGYLFDPESPKAPPWEHAREWGEAARRDSILGRERWLKSIPVMMAFMLRQGPKRSPVLSESRRTRAVIHAWPRYARFVLIRSVIAVRNRFFPGLKRNRARLEAGAR